MQSKEIQEKSNQACLKKYGFENPMQSEECKEKSKQTSLRKYGTEYPIQNLEVFLKREKQCFKRKEFQFPSGTIMIVQGEEPQFLKHIISENILNENEIQKGPVFKYTLSDGKVKHYFSDFFIKDLNLIVEIKSSYILNRYEKFMTEKENSVKVKGMNFILIIDQQYEQFDSLIKQLKENKV